MRRLDFFRQRLAQVETLRLDRNAPAAAGLLAAGLHHLQRHLWPTIAPWRRALGARGKTTLLRRGPLRMWLALRLCGPPLAEHCELTLNLCNQSISAWQAPNNDTHSTPDPGPVGWVQCSSCSRQTLLVSTLRKGSTSAPLLTATSSTVSGSHPRAERTVQTLAALAGHSLSYPTAVGVCEPACSILPRPCTAASLQRLPRRQR
jgi:hypothetical protein